jgi:hypothetical protein
MMTKEAGLEHIDFYQQYSSATREARSSTAASDTGKVALVAFWGSRKGLALLFLALTDCDNQ